ncbi:hypothetical protein BDV28DRAFT_136899 [Aspergillus coremiiformis]|uniref:Uncharacterized protein n=1 Tax=Aspergillus coremiiformis TaxID=138285 RepID=A0A5N6Z1K9_9EURO|nr:hypothetical protein BDV28DRAFT_136899 [Aspergillus coremiiformis]
MAMAVFDREYHLNPGFLPSWLEESSVRPLLRAIFLTIRERYQGAYIHTYKHILEYIEELGIPSNAKNMAFLWLFVAFGYLLLYAFAFLQTFDAQNTYLKHIAT